MAESTISARRRQRLAAAGPGRSAEAGIDCEVASRGDQVTRVDGPGRSRGRKAPGSALANPGGRSVSRWDVRAMAARRTSACETSRAHGGQVGRGDPLIPRGHGATETPAEADGVGQREHDASVDNRAISQSNHRGDLLSIPRGRGSPGEPGRRGGCRVLTGRSEAPFGRAVGAAAPGPAPPYHPVKGVSTVSAEIARRVVDSLSGVDRRRHAAGPTPGWRGAISTGKTLVWSGEFPGTRRAAPQAG
jgi:hypothetical protein